MALQQLRSSTANKRPTAGAMSDGQLAVNTNATNPGLFFKDADGSVRKVGPVFIGSAAPNASPASGGSTGHSVGEQWLDNSGGTYVLKIWDGTAWRSESGTFVDVSGDTMTGVLQFVSGSASAPGIAFSGDTNTGIFQPGADSVAIATGGTSRLFVDSSGNIGVGTSSPMSDAQLTLAADSDVGLGFARTGSAKFDAGVLVQSGHIYFKGGADSGTLAGLNHLMVLQSDGTVGIGTTSPSELLHLNGTNPFIYVEADSTTGNSGITFADGANKGQIMYDHNGDYMRFSTNGSSNERMRIDSSGNVGIGTTSPSAPLHVVGTIYGASNIGIRTSSPANNIHCHQDDSDASLIQFTNTTTGVTSSDGMVVGIDSSEQGAINVKENKSLIVSTNNQERLRIDSSGNVNIGNSSTPASANVHLDLYCNSSYDAFIRFRDQSGAPGLIGYDHGSNAMRFYTNGSGEAMRIDSSGNVAIGDTTADAKLHIRQDQNTTTGGTFTQPHIKLEALNTTNSTGFTGIAYGISTVDDYGWTVGAQRVSTSGADGAFVFRHHNNSQTGNERMRIDSSGNVGIGGAATSSASVKTLQVTDSTTARMLLESTGAGGRKYGWYTSVDGQFAVYDYTANSERMRLDSSGRLLLGTTTEGVGDASDLTIANPVRAGLTLRSNSSEFGTIAFSDATSGIGEYDGVIAYEHNNQAMRFSTASTEQMRIDSSGNVLIGKTSTTTTVQGAVINSSGAGGFTATSGICGTFNRLGTDGTLVNLVAQNVIEGTISVSGTDVSFNGATLSRWSQLSGGAERIEILRGSVLSNLDEMCEWGDEDNEQMNRMKVSDVEGDINVAGVFRCWDDDDDTYTNDFYCAMTGDFVIRIAQGTTVARGDLLMSAGDGTAKPQDDDIVRSKTIAKVTSTTVSATYSDGSYCVPCVLMAC